VHFVLLSVLFLAITIYFRHSSISSTTLMAHGYIEKKNSHGSHIISRPKLLRKEKDPY